MNNSELIDRAQGVARALSYNDITEASAKHTITELCHRLGEKTISIYHQQDGVMMVTSFGRTRFMTISERLLYRLFGIVPPMEGWKRAK